MSFLLAQINVGRIVAPLDSPVLSEFVANLERINILAEKSDGFVWRLKDESNNATYINPFDDPNIIINMSVWQSLDSLFQYVYKTDHVEVFKKRLQWFEKPSQMHMALWYVPAGHTPSVQEAIERLEHVRAHGETPYAFTFRKKFTAEEASVFQMAK